MAVTNRGMYRIFDAVWRGATLPTQFNLALVTGTPTVDTNTFGELTEIAAGNGYTSGGLAVARNSTDWPSLVEDDSGDLAEATLADKGWTASGGPIPASGSAALYLVLLDNNGTIANREVWAFFSLGGPRSVSAGQSITGQAAKFRAKQPA